MRANTRGGLSLPLCQLKPFKNLFEMGILKTWRKALTTFFYIHEITVRELIERKATFALSGTPFYGNCAHFKVLSIPPQYKEILLI